jgi:Tfp pilus assembly protein PilV
MTHRSAQLRTAVRRGFTFIEVMISATLVTLILGAIVAMTRAVAAGWTATEHASSMQVTAYQCSTMLYRLLQSANYVGLATADDQTVLVKDVITASPGAGAVLVFWTENGTDGRMQACEITLIEHDVNEKKLKLYQMPKGTPFANIREYKSDITTTPGMNVFKALPGMACRTIAVGVSRASFRAYYTDDTVNRQSVDYVLQFERDQQTRCEFGTVCLRCPTTPDDSK